MPFSYARSFARLMPRADANTSLGGRRGEGLSSGLLRALAQTGSRVQRAGPGEIDDGVILGLFARMRGAGLSAFVVPQAPDLPTGNRREDILIVRP